MVHAEDLFTVNNKLLLLYIKQKNIFALFKVEMLVDE